VTPELGAVVPRRFSSLPQAVSAPATSAVASATAAGALLCLSSLTDLAFLPRSGRTLAISHLRSPKAAESMRLGGQDQINDLG
jgi:hypothetical protein